MATAAGNEIRLCLVNRLTANTTAEMQSQRVDSGSRTKQYNPARLKARPSRCGSFMPTRPTSKAGIQISQQRHEYAAKRQERVRRSTIRAIRPPIARYAKNESQRPVRLMS